MYITKRSPNNPIITPSSGHPWESFGAFNPCPIKCKGVLYLVYRAVGMPDTLVSTEGMSTIGKSTSMDGKIFQSHSQLIVPEAPWEKYGCEDPRVTFFENNYYIFYTALSGFPYNKDNIKVACAISSDLEKIKERHLVTTFNAKAMALFPERINGKITVILTAHSDNPPNHIAIAQFNTIEEMWSDDFWKKWENNLANNTIDDPLRNKRDFVEVGSPPIKTEYGWLTFYCYIQNYFSGGERVFGIEALLLDLKNPKRIVGKTKGPIMVPQEIYERYGMTPNVVFPSGAVLNENGSVDVYYGGADTVCAKTSLNLSDLIGAMVPSKRVELAIRAIENPILTPNANNIWENKAVFNAAAIDLDGKIHLLYRAMGYDNTSVIGYASTKDGINITERLGFPAYKPRESFEMKKGSPNGNSGCEDPRITKIDDMIYMTYTAYDGVSPTHVALTSITSKDFLAKDFEKWSKPIIVTPENIDDKNMCLLPEKIGGQYMIMHRVGRVLCADFLDSLDFTKNRVTRCIEIMAPRPGMWDTRKIGIAGPPIKTEKGWLLIYHGISITGTYRLGAALLDLENPTVVIARTSDSVLEPIEPYEKIGQISNVVFSCGVILRENIIHIYYGGGDTTLNVAKISLKKILDILAPGNLN